MNGRNTTYEKQKFEGRSLLLKMDLLKRAFGITARQVYKKAGIKKESFGNDVLHARRISAPALLKIESAITHFSHSKNLTQAYISKFFTFGVQKQEKNFERF